MVKRRHALILALVFYLTATLFVVTSIGYDPWVDQDEDGDVDASDLYVLAGEYGTSGDPTKNITIVGHATKVIHAAVNVSVAVDEWWISDYISVDGYAKVTILIYITTTSYRYILRAYSDDTTQVWWFVDEATPLDEDFVKTYDVMHQRIRIQVQNLALVQEELCVDIYLMA